MYTYGMFLLVFMDSYGIRMEQQKFVHRFSVLIKGRTISCAQSLLQESGLAPAQWLVGKTKVFLKDDVALGFLDDKREEQIGASIVRVQALARGFIQRRRFAKIKETIMALGRYAKARLLEEEEAGEESAAGGKSEQQVE